MSIQTIARQRTSQVVIAGALLLSVASAAFSAGGASAQSAGFADPAFLRAWERADLPVSQGKVNRTWLWGPTPLKSLQEPFKLGSSSTHIVQYFDKARMEINNPAPAGNPNDPYYVTNGLLVVEMISGQVQTGVTQFDPSAPSDTQIAGDAGSDAPTYASLISVASVGVAPEHRAAPIAPGTPISPVYIDRQGTTSNLSPSLQPRAVSVSSAGFVNETGHNIADVFWAYLNSTGPVYENGTYGNGPLMNWVSATGFPVTEPYWTRINVAGRERLVLFQAFQRRILTYSPENPAGWKVEMGNVGSQYYAWRYETPKVACQRVPLRGFGRVWADHITVQKGLGCPLSYPPFDKEQAIQTAYQTFERGTMLWVSRTVYTQEKLIYVFFNDGTFQQFDDTWRDGQPANAGLQPPQGLYEPQRGFGKVWREGTGARVRERLGWATAPEAGGTGAYQRFTLGEMYWTSTANKIYALYGTLNTYPGQTPVPGATPFRYGVFDDTFTP